MACAKFCMLTVLLSIGVVYGQEIQVPYDLRGFTQLQGVPAAQDFQQGTSEGVFIMNNPGDQTLEFPKSFLNRFSDPSSQRIKFLKSTGNNGVAFTGSFPGATPEQSFFGAPTPFFQSFNRRAGSGTQNFGFQQSFDESLGEVNGFFTDSGPLSFASTSGTRRVIEALPDVTLTRTVTVDRFVTTTDVAFVRQPFTATIFSILTQTAVTTVVVPTPVVHSIEVNTDVVTRPPVTVTVIDVRSEFQYVTRTQLKHITLTHTSYRFTRDTLLTTVTRVQTISTTVTRTDINTVTTTLTENRAVTSTVFPSYY